MWAVAVVDAKQRLAEQRVFKHGHPPPLPPLARGLVNVNSTQPGPSLSM
jgi:hypothetical protein